MPQAYVDIMLSQIKPHFLYNTLTAIRQMCDSNPGQAKDSMRLLPAISPFPHLRCSQSLKMQCTKEHFSREEGGTIILCTEETPAAYRIVIQDDGVGLSRMLETWKSAAMWGLIMCASALPFYAVVRWNCIA